jgi:hypothetical protein
MDGTILSQGTFVANSTNLSNPNPGVASIAQANAQIIVIPSNADFVKVYNYTRYGTVGTTGAYFNGVANASVGVEFYWQRGMAPGTGIVKYYGAASQVLDGDTLVSGGFTLYDPSGQSQGALPLLGNAIATTASTNVVRPVVSTGNTAGVIVGSVVRLSNTAQTDINGIDFVVGAVTANTSFTLLTASNPLANAPGAIGGAGFYRLVNTDGLYYPRRRWVVNITQAVNAQVSTSVAHGYVAGQAIRFNIPAVSGMIQLNSTPENNYMTATVLTVVDQYNFTININTTAFTAFTWPTIAQQPSSFPIVDPVGEDSATALMSLQPQTPMFNGQQIYNTNTGVFSDATINTGFLGMILGNGGNGNALGTPIIGPSGALAWSAGNVATGDVVYWVAGKSTLGGL